MPEKEFRKIDRDELVKAALYSNKRSFKSSIRCDPKLWAQFKESCAIYGLSTCAVLEVCMKGWIEGQKVMSTFIQPLVQNITMQHIVKRPRRMIEIPALSTVGCEKLTHANWLPSHIGWCKTSEKWVRLEDCNSCVKHV
jgi:hypothetical protein